MPDDITISIDGVEIKTQPGKMALEAAIDAGVCVTYPVPCLAWRSTP